MRVLFVIPGEDSGNGMIFARRQASSLRDAGVLVHEFFLRSRTSVEVLGKEWCRLRGMIQEVAPDIVHAHYGTMTSLLSVLVSRKPLVITVRGSDLNPCPNISVIRSAAGRLCSQASIIAARRVICVSEELRHRVRWGKAKSLVIPSGVDLKEFIPINRRDARQRVGWKGDEKVVLFNGARGSRLKRIDLALGALECARTELPHLRMHVLNEDVPPATMPLYLNAADALLLTSDYEGSPNIVKEGLACNLPVVSVDAGDVRERLAGVYPSAVVPRDAAAIGRALIKVLQSGGRSNGREHVQDLSLPRIARRIIKVYEEVVKAARD
jgi:teichuronic acid biosynthesis glycosyltransferase TuaC